MRTIIDLPETDLTELDRLCKQEGISRAEAVRRAIGLKQQRQGASQEVVGLWRGRIIQGQDDEDALRDERAGHATVRIPYKP